ncbi:protein kinase [Cystobacter fuscus]|uniref:Protein kinase n=1 Tax=Cystobacter fuscus TaxID=43 RepID=A0A250IW29_9BACT|nr:protein kinase [Cystobacter fuscus]
MERAARGEEPPCVGEVVDGYRLERRLGEGGQGTVFRARRDGQLHALKFLPLGNEDRAWRELEVRLRLRRMQEVGVSACGPWPSARPRYLYLVMPYVHGRSLPDWAREHNPTARQTARVLADVARQLVRVHRAGVVHRDIKGDNVLVRHEDGRAVLVDFGVGTYWGALDITHPLAMPGTPRYRSPEALRFRREHLGEHSPGRPSDDLWALGVVLYWLLTGVHPFYTNVPDEGALANVILQHHPEPPHMLNPRVPRALSELCLRMLEKSLAARPQSAQAVGEEVEALLSSADGTWDVALCEEWEEDDASTPQEVWLDWGELRDRAWRLAAQALRRPLRGRALPPEEASTATTSPTPASQRTRLWSGTLATFVLGGSLCLPPPVSGLAPPGIAHSGQEVAAPGEPPEGGHGAAPEWWAEIPVPVASATPWKDSTRVSTSTPSPVQSPAPSSSQTPVLGKLVWACTTAAALAQASCAGPSQELRRFYAEPTPAECPEGAVETMQKLGMFDVPVEPTVEFPNPGLKNAEVRPGPVTVISLMTWGELPTRTTRFTGELFFGETLVHGRFTQAHTADGHTYPICAELWLGYMRKGLVKEKGSTRDTALVRAWPTLRAVKRFE